MTYFEIAGIGDAAAGVSMSTPRVLGAVSVIPKKCSVMSSLMVTDSAFSISWNAVFDFLRSVF